jgi:iron complex transport system substrate-binding protein
VWFSIRAPMSAVLTVGVALAASLPILARPARAAAPMRIVSLAPSVTETLFALGAGREVVGVSNYCDYPPAALKLPKVGSFLTPNIEAIVALRPTLVIGLSLSSDQREIHALNSMGCPVLKVQDASLQEIEDSIATVGARIGRAEQARKLCAAIAADIAQVRERLAGTASLRVLMLVGHQPMVAVGPGTYLDDLLRIAGADNIADSFSESWPQLSVEYVIAMRPDVIIDGQMGTDPLSPSHFWEKYSTIPAVRNHRVYGYAQDPILHAGPRVGQSLEILAAMIHPDAFRTAAEKRP